ncbi:Lrp/AsnC family transcriptional regulator [Endozoicomonas sp. G2_1]|uniref:Lrp/AsnC family transcriptional regulator n=1 Tax=Endozoicomonas sp. G2_1 TaxID=2821091 RepID=UPI001ADB1D7D|nr:Lrp/AsnC family transcriptional regulator [Endozoicomonas sp. G2_1]MBO9489998.1 Lrp/AsnC family transcriptional regulator [Endozoicomonas sp. G2_1]
MALSEKDEQLLAILRCNARASVSDLARGLNVSRTTVQNRIAKLENSGVIKSYSVELGETYASGLVSVHVSLKVTPKLRQQVSIALRKIHQISQHYSISGDYDFLAIIRAPSLAQVSQILDDICQLDGVERTNSSLILETIFTR